MSETDTTPTQEAAPIVPGPVPVETFSRDYVEGLRSEAAKYRNEKKDAVEAAKAAVAAEWEAKFAAKDVEFAALQSDSLSKDVTLAKVKAAIDLKVPSDKVLAFAEHVKGDTEEAIAESAKSVFELAGGFSTTSPAFDPTQGSGGNHLPLNGDPLLNALKKAVGA